MTPQLKNLFGSSSKDQDHAEELRVVLRELQQERHHCEALIHSVHASADRLQYLGEPIAKAETDVGAVAARLSELEERFTAMVRLSTQFETLDERAQALAQNQTHAETQIATAVDDAQRIRTLLAETGQKIDLVLSLKDQLEAFLQVDRPFQQLRGDAESLRGQVDNTGEQLARLREQNDRLQEAHKLAMSKMEALDRRRDDLGRSMQDKERRVATVEQAVRGMDGIQSTVGDVKREIGALKALGDSVVQKSATLEAQRDAVDRALAQAEHLDRAMRQIDAGVRQQQTNEKALNALQDQVAALRSLHEAVVERSSEISQLQRDTDERTRETRQDMASLTDEMKKTVERFDFESRGLESVSQRVADLRGALTDCEIRFKGLSEPSQAVGEIQAKTEALGARLQILLSEVGQVDQGMEQFHAIRRDLDETERTARDLGGRILRIEEVRPTVETVHRHLEQLSGAEAQVKDALEQTQLAYSEIARVRESQSETKTWLVSTEQSVHELRAQVGELNRLTPSIDVVQKQAQRLGDSIAAIESRQEHVANLHRRMADLGALGARLDERDRQLQTRMEAAEQRFVGLETRAEETEQLSRAVASVTSSLSEAEVKTGEITKVVASIVARCESVEEIAEQTRALRPELDQRQHALSEAAKDLERVSELRKESAISAQQFDELVARLTTAVEAAEKRAARVDELSARLDARTAGLQSVERQLAQFEERVTKLDPAGQEIARSLEQITSRQGVVEALQADFDRMFAMAEKTTAEVREITSAQQEVEQSRALLMDVMGRLREVRETANALDERKRQMTKAEERLARAEALLSDVQSSLEALQGQKSIVDQAVEKTGSLQFLLKQAEAAIEGLRQEREMSTRVRAAVAIVRSDDDDDEDVPQAQAA